VSYDDFGQHELMLKDSVRTVAFERAIREVVRPGMTVLDFGCGTGILSFFAERAGAERVFAIDSAYMLHAAETIARKNGFHRITFIRTDGDSFELPEKVDAIISEWMGMFILREPMLTPLLRAREAHLRPGGVMLPSAVRWYGAFIVNRSFYEEKAFFETRPYDIDFSPVRDWAFAEVSSRSMQTEHLSTAFSMGALDTLTAKKEPAVVEGATSFDADITIYGLCGWFDATLSGSVVLDTGPAAPPTHWKQLVFPLPRPLSIAAHETVSVRVKPIRFEGKAAHWHWSIATPREGVEWDDFSYRAHIRRKG
jgi:SAM-dependent methyltransferase